MRCADCHVVPAHEDDPGHIDPAPAELAWGSVGAANGVAPAYDGGTCTVYCHGPTLTGGRFPSPQWANSGSTQAYCGDCHGLPPPAPHPQDSGSDCSTCHPNARPGLGFKEPERHVDGVLDVTTTCLSCHGSGGNSAPPTDTAGGSATALRTVGAHRQHLGPSAWHQEVQCADCHVVPTRVDAPGHLGPPPAELRWSSRATAKGANPAFDGASCATVYCHGATISGGSNQAPDWTSVGTGEASCGTCHSNPPTSPPHDGGMTLAQCGTCHGQVFNAASGGFVSAALHINGNVEVSGAGCGSCHDLPPATGAHLKHAGLARGVFGGLDTAADLPSPAGYAYGCAYCHPVAATKHMQGGAPDQLALIELYDATVATSSLKRKSPTAGYTRGAQVFTDAKGKKYTLGTCTNVYCHSAPSYSTPSAVPVPGVDFAFTSYPVAYPAYALNLGRSFKTVGWGDPPLSCAGCHDSPVRSAAPAVLASAGQSHSWLDGSGAESGHGWNHGWAPLACRTCHAQTVSAANATSRIGANVSVYGDVPITGFGAHVDGNPDVAFDPSVAVQYRSSFSLSSASYDPTTATCSNVACHLNQTAVKHGTPSRPITVTIECNTCHQY